MDYGNKNNPPCTNQSVSLPDDGVGRYTVDYGNKNNPPCNNEIARVFQKMKLDTKRWIMETKITHHALIKVSFFQMMKLDTILKKKKLVAGRNT